MTEDQEKLKQQNERQEVLINTIAESFAELIGIDRTIIAHHDVFVITNIVRGMKTSPEFHYACIGLAQAIVEFNNQRIRDAQAAKQKREEDIKKKPQRKPYQH